MTLTYPEQRKLIDRLIEWAADEPESIAGALLNNRRVLQRVAYFLGVTELVIPKVKRQRRKKTRFSDIERTSSRVYEENFSEHQEIINEMIGDTGK